LKADTKRTRTSNNKLQMYCWYCSRNSVPLWSSCRRRSARNKVLLQVSGHTFQQGLSLYVPLLSRSIVPAVWWKPDLCLFRVRYFLVSSTGSFDSILFFLENIRIMTMTTVVYKDWQE
jgi:hypothetical protein